MKNLCIIPARGGSKRIPRKNIKPFMGKPIMAYSIEAALESGLFDEVMVSTDDVEFAKVAKKYGANVPFLRSAQTSNDFATTNDVLNEVLDRYETAGYQFDTLACVYSTAPFISAQRLREAYQKLENCDLAYPVVQYSYPIQRSLVIRDGVMTRMWPEYSNSRSQDLEATYHDAGQYYFYRVKPFRNGAMLRTCGIVLSELEVQDLDTETDWKLAEMKYRLISKNLTGGGANLV
ncbi:MAG: pseudaminic acid cytidylyltransferase [Bacteroidaceae bacterium]|nr:pseudaminic acid cytidylyltransferase [Bacteroidaceae bacterium]